MKKWGHFWNFWLSKPKSRDCCFGDYVIIISNFAIKMKVSGEINCQVNPLNAIVALMRKPVN